MTTTPSDAATRLHDDLATMLDAIHAHFADQVEPAISAAIEHRDFGPGRRLLADVECITAAVDATLFSKTVVDRCSMMHFSDGLCGAIFELSGTNPVDAVLEDIDPERLANDERNIAQLRAAGRWSDVDDVKTALERAETAARYPA